MNAKTEKPQHYRYVGIEDIKIGGRDIRNGDIIEGDNLAGDKRFEKVSAKEAGEAAG